MVVCDNVFYFREKTQENNHSIITQIDKETIHKYPKLLTFTDKHLEVLGITDKYIKYFYDDYIASATKIETCINCLPNSNDLDAQRQLFNHLCNADDLYFELQFFFEEAERRIHETDLTWNNNIYYWMGFRPWVRDAPELQIYKIYPDLKYHTRKSWLYLYDKKKYVKYLKDYRRTHPLKYFIYKLRGVWSTD